MQGCLVGTVTELHVSAQEYKGANNLDGATLGREVQWGSPHKINRINVGTAADKGHQDGHQAVLRSVVHWRPDVPVRRWYTQIDFGLCERPDDPALTADCRNVDGAEALFRVDLKTEPHLP